MKDERHIKMLKGISQTTKLKINWLTKRKEKLRLKVDTAFAIVKRELVMYLRQVEEPDVFQKYLAQALQTDDVTTFIAMLQDLIENAKHFKQDPIARQASLFSKYIIFRINYLSHFTLWWTTVSVKCPKCHSMNVTNFLYTDKLCKTCGNIIL